MVESVDLLTTYSFELKKFSNAQKHEIQLGVENGLSEEQILLYAKQENTWYFMREYRLGLMHGLPPEAILLYAKSKYNALEMRNMRERTEILFDSLHKMDIQYF